MEPKPPSGGMTWQGSPATASLPNMPVEAVGIDAGAPCVQQLVGSLELRLTKQLSDIDRKLDLLATDIGGGFEQLATMSYLKAQPPSPHSPHAPPHPQQPPASPMVPPSHAPSLSVYEAANDEQALASWISAYRANCGTPAGGLTDASTVDKIDNKPFFNRSNTHRSGNDSIAESALENATTPTPALPECLLKRRPSVESNLSPLFNMMSRVQPSDWAQKTWTFLEDPQSSAGALWYSRIWAPLIAVTVAVTLWQTTDAWASDTELLQPLELSFDVVFMLEAIIRYLVCPTTCTFVRNPLNWIDVVAALPLLVRAPCLWDAYSCEEDTWAYTSLFNIAPTFRLLKTLRHFQQFHLFLKLLKETREALSVLIFTLCIIVLAFSSLIYMVEPRNNIGSLPKAMYMVIVTISTVGYGDVTPKSNTGSVVITATIVCSVLYMAMPIGIIGNAFTQIWTDRDRILMTVRTRDRLEQWGYTAKDMQMLFRHFDRNNNGELTLPEFRKMIAEMRIGIQDQDERVVQLFESFDRDGSGGIDEKEFTRALFPSAYHELYSSPRVKQQVQESNGNHHHLGNLDPTRFLRQMNFPLRSARRSDSKASDKNSESGVQEVKRPSDARATVQDVEGGEGKGEGQATRFLPLAISTSFHSNRSSPKTLARQKTNERAETGTIAPQDKDTKQANGQEPANGVLMDVPPLFGVCC